MTIQDQIIGFRRDRIGARLICMLNVMRLSRKFGVSGTYLWLREPEDSPYPELADPGDFLAADFVARHIRIIDQPPERGQRQNVNTVTSGSNVEGFAAMLAAGRLYECDSLAEIIRFMDEPAADAAADIRDIARQVVRRRRWPRRWPRRATSWRVRAAAIRSRSMSGAAIFWTAILGPTALALEIRPRRVLSRRCPYPVLC